MGIKRPRLRRWAKWACTVAAVCLLFVIVMSARLYATYQTNYSAVSISFGKVFLTHSDHPFSRTGLEVGTHVFHLNWDFQRLLFPGIPGMKGVAAPLWPHFLLFAAAAIMTWRADVQAQRRIRAAACLRSGYDRRGLAVGVKCPECGTVPSA